MNEATKSTSGSPRFLIDTLKYVPLKVVPAISGLLTIYFLTKNFSEVNYINYASIMATILLSMQLFGGWVNSSMMYFIPTANSEKDEVMVLNHFFVIQVFLSLTALFVVFFTILGTIDDLLIAFLSGFIIVFQLIINFLSSFLQAKRMIKAQVLSTSLQSILQICAVLVSFFYFKDQLLPFFLLYSLSFIPSIITLLLNKNIDLGNFRIGKNWIGKEMILKIVAYGLPMCIWFFSTQFYSIGDRLLLKYFGVTENVVNYVAFKDLAIGLSGFVSMPLLFASHPIIMRLVLRDKDVDAAAKVIEQNIKILLLVFLPFILLMLFYGKLIIGTFLGEKFVLETMPMIFVILTILTNIVSIYLQKGLEVSFGIVYMLKVSLLAALFSLVLNLIFIPFFGVQSSIIIAFFCQLLYAFVIYFRSRKFIHFSLGNVDLVFFLVVMLFTFLLVYLKPTGLLWNVAIIIYITGIMFFSLRKIGAVAFISKLISK